MLPIERWHTVRIEWDPKHPDQETGWVIRSAYERKILARAGVYGLKEDKPNLPLRNPLPIPPRPALTPRKSTNDDIEKEYDFNDEAGFIIRELKYEPIFVTWEQAKTIENGLWSIAEKETPFRGVLPAEAAIVLTLLEEQREERAKELAAKIMPATTELELVPQEDNIELLGRNPEVAA